MKATLSRHAYKQDEEAIDQRIKNKVSSGKTDMGPEPVTFPIFFLGCRLHLGQV